MLALFVDAVWGICHCLPMSAACCGAILRVRRRSAACPPLCESYVPAEQLWPILRPSIRLQVRLCDTCPSVSFLRLLPGEDIFPTKPLLLSYADHGWRMRSCTRRR